MTNDIMADIFNEQTKVAVSSSVRYKILDKNDDDYQGLYKEATAVYLSKKGMTLNMKQKIKADDPMLIELVLDDGLVIKACCESISCLKNSDSGFDVEVEFIIIKNHDKMYIDNYINEKAM